MTSRCVIDVGNTSIASAIYDEGMLLEPSRTSTGDIVAVSDIEQLIDDVKTRTGKDFNCVIASAGVARIKTLLEEYEKASTFSITFVSGSNPCGVEIQYDIPESLGADRVANTIGAKALHPQPTLVIDCGTAITIDYVDEEGCFAGGIIAPGMHMGRDALVQYAPALPNVELYPKPHYFENSTDGCIRSGIINGALALTEKYAKEILARTPEATVVLTGGDAILIKDDLLVSNNVKYEEWLTLYGLGFAEI